MASLSISKDNRYPRIIGIALIGATLMNPKDSFSEDSMRFHFRRFVTFEPKQIIRDSLNH